MTAGKYREVVTVDGKNITIQHDRPPVQNVSADDPENRFQKLDVFDAKFRPENYNKADGAPLRLFESGAVNIDLSKRSKEDMGFWHRNSDYHEVIFCVRGALKWETELGTVTLRSGEMIIIPKGISHRSMLSEDSEAENVLLELKVRDELTFAGDPK